MTGRARIGRDGVRITLLVDNEPGTPGLRAQWGFSAWIEYGEARVLLDSGATGAFVRNAGKLGVSLECADAFVLSHGHGDHGGGIPALAAAAPGADIVLHPAALAPRYWLGRTGKVEPIGLPARPLDGLLKAAGRLRWAATPLEVAPRVWATGPIPRRHPLEEAEPNFYLDPACTLRDHVVDDQAVWVEGPGGLTVLVGCAHAGIINTMDYVRRLVLARHEGGEAALPLAADGLPRVRAVVGGMHLLHASAARLRATSDAMTAAGVEALAPVHCTGKRGKRHLRERLPEAFVAAATGSVLEVD